MVIDDDLPCGRCDCGTYSEYAMLNRKARKFGALDEAEREQAIPRCKTFDRECIGARHFHDALVMLDKEGEQQ